MDHVCAQQQNTLSLSSLSASLRLDEFYENVQGNEDPADTAKSGVFVLDQQIRSVYIFHGNIRRCEASGLFLKTPNIPGVGRVRLRYPITPIHQYGSPVWKDLNALKDTFQAYVNSVTFEMVPAAAIHGSHTHLFIITVDQHRQLRAGETMEMETTQAFSHTHSLSIRYDSDNDRFEYINCGSSVICRDNHGTLLKIVSNSVTE